MLSVLCINKYALSEWIHYLRLTRTRTPKRTFPTHLNRDIIHSTENDGADSEWWYVFDKNDRIILPPRDPCLVVQLFGPHVLLSLVRLERY